MTDTQRYPREPKDILENWEDSFKVQYANKPVNRLDIGANYRFNTGRHRLIDNGTFIERTTDTTNFVDQPGDWQINASAGDTITFGARELLRYVPNFEVLWGVELYTGSDLTTGQTLFLELVDPPRENGYQYRFDETGLTLRQLSGGIVVDSEGYEYTNLQNKGWSLTQPFVTRASFNWYGAGQAEYKVSYPTNDGQYLEDFGQTFNKDGVATEECNLRPQVTVDLTAGASDLEVNIGSIGAAILGDAIQINRTKGPAFWDLGGSISQDFTDDLDDAAVLAARIDPNRNNVSVQTLTPAFKPAGSGVTIEMLVGAVHKDNPDLTVNFEDPDNDGVDEGTTGAIQTREQNDVMQYTRDVTSFPTITQTRVDYPPEGNTQVPDVRTLSSALGSSGTPSTGGSQSTESPGESKRTVYPDDVILFLARTKPTSSTTNGSIDYLVPIFEQDF